jgi:hypothetical protein
VHKRITPYDESAPPDAVKDGLQEAQFAVAIEHKTVVQISREDIISDFLDDYEMYLRSQRK